MSAAEPSQGGNAPLMGSAAAPTASVGAGATAQRVFIEGVGLLGPGLASWSSAQAVLRGAAPYVSRPTVLLPPARLAAAERRRASAVIRIAMAVADEAVAQAAIDPRTLATVFTSSGGDGVNCHALCETLAGDNRLLSPTRFTNSVHNAAAGYWHIAVASRAASTSLSAHDGSFAAGLIEAATQVCGRDEPVLLVAYDMPYPEPLHALRALPDHFGLALLLAPAATRRSLAALDVVMVEAAPAGSLTDCNDAALDALRRSIPAAAALPLLQALASGGECELTLAYLPALQLRVGLHFGVAAS